jgi:hypothetical protein
MVSRAATLRFVIFGTSLSSKRTVDPQCPILSCLGSTEVSHPPRCSLLLAHSLQSALVRTAAVVQQQIQRTADAWHTVALSKIICPPHSIMCSSTSSIPRAYQLHLQLLGGISHTLLRKLDLQCKARGFVACKVASRLARGLFRCLNEEGDRRWVAFIATKSMFNYLLPYQKYQYDCTSGAKVQKLSMVANELLIGASAINICIFIPIRCFVSICSKSINKLNTTNKQHF